MTYTIDTAYSHGVLTVESQKKFLKGELSCIPEYNFEFTSTPSCDQGIIYARSSLTPVIEKKMSGKNLAENVMSGLIQTLLSKCGEGEVDNTIYVVLPTEKSPCLSVSENKDGEVMLRAELSFYMG